MTRTQQLAIAWIGMTFALLMFVALGPEQLRSLFLLAIPISFGALALVSLLEHLFEKDDHDTS